MLLTIDIVAEQLYSSVCHVASDTVYEMNKEY